jgi:hypothetical protein
MNYLDEMNTRFLNHLRSDVDVSVGLGLPDPTLANFWLRSTIAAPMIFTSGWTWT